MAQPPPRRPREPFPATLLLIVGHGHAVPAARCCHHSSWERAVRPPQAAAEAERGRCLSRAAPLVRGPFNSTLAGPCCVLGISSASRTPGGHPSAASGQPAGPSPHSPEEASENARLGVGGRLDEVRCAQPSARPASCAVSHRSTRLSRPAPRGLSPAVGGHPLAPRSSKSPRGQRSFARGPALAVFRQLCRGAPRTHRHARTPCAHGGACHVTAPRPL